MTYPVCSSPVRQMCSLTIHSIMHVTHYDDKLLKAIILGFPGQLSHQSGGLHGRTENSGGALLVTSASLSLLTAMPCGVRTSADISWFKSRDVDSRLMTTEVDDEISVDGNVTSSIVFSTTCSSSLSLRLNSP